MFVTKSVPGEVTGIIGPDMRGRCDITKDLTLATLMSGSTNRSSSDSSCQTSCLFRYSKDSARAMDALEYTSRAPNSRSSTLLQP